MCNVLLLSKVQANFITDPGDDDQYRNYLTGPYLVQGSFSTGPGDDDQYRNYLAEQYLIQGSFSIGPGDDDQQGRIQRGAHPAHAPPKIGKNKIFWRKIGIFHTKYPKNFRASLCNWKKYDFLA